MCACLILCLGANKAAAVAFAFVAALTGQMERYVRGGRKDKRGGRRLLVGWFER